MDSIKKNTNNVETPNTFCSSPTDCHILTATQKRRLQRKRKATLTKAASETTAGLSTSLNQPSSDNIPVLSLSSTKSKPASIISKTKLIPIDVKQGSQTNVNSKSNNVDLKQNKTSVTTKPSVAKTVDNLKTEPKMSQPQGGKSKLDLKSDKTTKTQTKSPNKASQSTTSTSQNVKQSNTKVGSVTDKVSPPSDVKSNDGVVPELNTDSGQSEKSRELIKADREAKKLAKQAVKTKKTSTEPQSTVGPQTDVSKNALPENKAVKESEVSQQPGDAVSEKSREAIKAEREAKKLAKQAGKVKKNDGGSEKVENVASKTLQPQINKQPQVNVAPAPATQSATNQENADKTEKSKSELRAERRAKQEAQRAAKEQLLTSKPSQAKADAADKSKAAATKDTIKKSVLPKSTSKSITLTPEKSKIKHLQNHHKVKFFNHLYTSLMPHIPVNSNEIHPAVVKLGVQYSSRIIVGSNARCIALLNALRQVIRDYSLPPNVEFCRGLESHLEPCINFLKGCRLPAVSMNNALKHIKWQLTQLPHDVTETNAKEKLQEGIATYVKEQIEVAGQAISNAVKKKISQGDTILTYSCSSLIVNILVDAAAAGKEFQVVVVEAHPWSEGREMLRRLTAHSIPCSLIMISALSFVMRQINKVLLGAGALLNNGYVMARAGTAQVALVAHAHNVPVLVCCETHKSSERVQTDSFVYNEIGNPDDLVNCWEQYKDSPLKNWRNMSSLTPLNLTYDVTPPDLVTAVVTELAILPCTSVPVILRIKPSEFGV